MQDLEGERLAGRYHLLARLAGGGMGEVYRAHDQLLERVVAIKVLQPALAADPELVDRFKAEARAAARLTHPNVVAVHDWGSEGESTYYMVMEFVSGPDLRDVLVARGCLEPAQAAEIVASVCDALAAAHSRGLVHRDVKPENVLIARDGKVKVADFGIAVVVDADRTMPGGVISGTLRYLSPEQAQGLESTAASDIWAAGALLSELLTGRPPLQGAGVDFLRRRASDDPVAPSEADPRVPRELDEIALRATALDPAERFPDASAMANSLRRVTVRDLAEAAPVHSLVDDVTTEIRLPESAPTTRMGRRRRRRRGLRMALLALLVCALAAGGAAGARLLLAPGLTRVPDVVGEARGQAAAELRRAGLGLRVTGSERHFGAPRGEIISQDPTSGRAREGSAVSVVVSAGLPLTRVPDVVGLAMDAAGKRLNLVGMEVGRVTNSYSRRRRGAVIAQTPSRGSIPWGGEIDLVLSRGPRPVAVPAVEGAPLDRARKRLRLRGFEIEVARAYSNSVRRARVIEIAPGPGAIVPEGSPIVLTVSRGPRFERVRMPDVRGLAVAEARARLESLGLRVRVVHTGAGGSSVAETDPIAGSMQRENDLVALFV